MGVLGSKENLGQIVVIYGYNSNDFCWRQNDNKSIYHTSGLIISHNKKKYIITTRTKLIGCKNIVMYHCYFHGSEPIMRNNLQILFQSIEYNIIVLVSENHNVFDLSASEIISGNYDPKIICPSYNIINNIFVVPTKKSHYYTVRMDLDLESDTINYRVHIYDAKFVKSVIYDKTFVPENYLYDFILQNNESDQFQNNESEQFQNNNQQNMKCSDLVGICGAVIFNKKYQLVGIVSKSENKHLYVLPKKALSKIIGDFLEYLDKPNGYYGSLSLPFTYDMSKNNTNLIIASTCSVNTPSGKKLLKINDELISINDNQVIIKNGNILVFDSQYKENIPMDIYLKINITKDIPIKLVILRRKIFMNINVYGSNVKNQVLLLTNQSHFHPICSIPYIKISNIIVVQLTHELLDITMTNKIIIKNDIIDAFLENTLDKIDNKLLIIDCLDSVLTKKYGFPRIFPNENQTLICPIVTMVNGKNVSVLEDLENIIFANNSENIILVEMGDDQFEIML
jgi:hypothetical protein